MRRDTGDDPMTSAPPMVSPMARQAEQHCPDDAALAERPDGAADHLSRVAPRA